MSPYVARGACSQAYMAPEFWSGVYGPEGRAVTLR